MIHRILEDSHGDLWMSSNRGVFRVRMSELNDFAAHRTTVIHSDSYGRADGMRDSECNGGAFPAGWKTSDGRLWFATLKGAAGIKPEIFRKNPFPPPVLIDQL